MKNFQQNLDKLEAADTQVLGVSMDSPFANKAFADSVGAKFLLASDWFNEGAVTRSYGAWNPKYRAAERITYLIDKTGRIAEIQNTGAIDPTKIVVACERRKLKN